MDADGSWPGRGKFNFAVPCSSVVTKLTTILGETAADSHLIDNHQWSVSRGLPGSLSGHLL